MSRCTERSCPVRFADGGDRPCSEDHDHRPEITTQPPVLGYAHGHGRPAAPELSTEELLAQTRRNYLAGREGTR